MILCCRIPEVPIAALVLKQPELGAAPRPLVVGGHPSERKPVLAASPEARSFGVCVGMPLRQAEQLCPQALFLAADPAAEKDLARHLLAGLYAMAPRVELAGDAGEAYVDLAGMELAGGGGGEAALPRFAARVGDYLERRLCSRPRLGIGSNKFVAFTAAGLVAPTGRMVPAGRECSFLAPLSIAAHLPVDPALVERLRLFGLRTLGDLAAMPLASVESQFGQEGLFALRLARGEDPRRLQPWEPPQRMEERTRVDPPVDNLEPLLFLARGLVDRLGQRLVDGGHAATTVRLKLELDGAPEVELALHLRAPMSTADELWQPVAGLLRRQQVAVAVGGIGLRLGGFCPARSRQLDLLTRRDGRLFDIVRQLQLLSDAHGPRLVRVAEPAAVAPPLDERRFAWGDPIEVLGREAQPRRRAARTTP